jgi:hypothetical protein
MKIRWTDCGWDKRPRNPEASRKALRIIGILIGLFLIASATWGASTPTRIISLSGTLAFGTVTVGLSSASILTIYNTGNSTLSVNSISYPGGFSGNWSGNIEAGCSHPVTVTFSPTSAFSYSGPVTVTSNKTSGTNTTIASGFGTSTSKRIIISLKDDLVFGSVLVGSSPQRTLTISNSGNSTLSVSNISYPKGFSGSYSGNIAASGSQPVTVTFKPTSAISYDGPVTVTSNKTSGTFAITASGTGTLTTTRVISLNNLAFGNVTVGTSSPRTLTISNTGNSAMTVSGITYSTSVFSGNWSSGTIAAGGSQNVTVTFKPTSASSYNGTVTVTCNKTGGTNTIAASGTGTAKHTAGAVDNTVPGASSITSPSPGSTLTSSSVTFQWSAGVGVSNYFLDLGSAVGGSDLYHQSQGTTNLSVTVSGLPTDGRIIYARLWSYIAGNWQYSDTSYTATH